MTKAELRKLYLSKRSAIPPEIKKERDAAICEIIAQSDLYHMCDTLFAYYPVRGEIDLLPLLHRARAEGKSVALPVLRGDEMLFCRFDGETHTGKYGIPEPTGDIISPDGRTLCIVPGLAYDSEGFRLGYGGGYYDRFLCDFSGGALGAFYSDFCAENLPHDDYDMPLNCIITEKGML